MADGKKFVIKAGSTYIPPDAKGDAKKEAWWGQNPLERLAKHLFMDQETAEEDVAMIFGSFRTPLVERAIRNRWDLMPVLLKASGMESPWLREPALAIMSNNSIRILLLLRGRHGRGPVVLREVIRKHHPDRAALFDTPDGWAWLDQTCYDLARWIYSAAKLVGPWWYEEPRGTKLVPPPGTVEIQT